MKEPTNMKSRLIYAIKCVENIQSYGNPLGPIRFLDAGKSTPDPTVRKEGAGKDRKGTGHNQQEKKSEEGPRHLRIYRNRQQNMGKVSSLQILFVCRHQISEALFRL